MVVVVADGFEMKRGKQRERNGLEEVFCEFGAEITYFVSFEFCIEFDPRAAGSIQRTFCFAFVHWQHETKAGDTSFVADGLF